MCECTDKQNLAVKNIEISRGYQLAVVCQQCDEIIESIGG